LLKEFTGAVFQSKMSKKPVFISRKFWLIIALFAAAQFKPILSLFLPLPHIYTHINANINHEQKCGRKKVNKNRAGRALSFGRDKNVYVSEMMSAQGMEFLWKRI
jgi:hypothetical protein